MALSPLPFSNFILPNGQPVADGEVLIRLNKDCLSPTGQVSTRTVTVALDSNGAPIGAPLFWPNSELKPVDSIYLFSVKSEKGQRIVQWQPLTIGASTPMVAGFGMSFGQSFGS